MPIYVHVYGMTTDALWFGNRIYLTLWYNSWLRFPNPCYVPTSVFSHNLNQSSGNGFQPPIFPFLWIPELSLYISHSKFRLTSYPKTLNEYTLGIKVKVIWRSTVSRPLCPGVKATIKARDRFFYFLEIFLDSWVCFLWHPLWREDGSVIYCCCWA
jgi:hypothetical protein